MLTSRTFQHSASWFNMLCYTVFLFPLTEAEVSPLNYSPIVLLPTPSVKTLNTKHPGTWNYNIATVTFYNMESTSSTRSQPTPPAGSILLQTFKSYEFLSSTVVSRARDQEQDTFVYANHPSLSNSLTITRNSEFSKISRELRRPSPVVTENHRTSTNGSDNSFQVHSTKNEYSSNSESPNRTVTKMTSCENDEKKCHGYVTRWVDFYLNVGGWIMLAVVLLGVISLIVTHILGRSTNYSEITGLRGREVHGRYRAHWI